MTRQTVTARLNLLQGDPNTVFVETQVDGVRAFTSVGDLIRCYQKHQHATNRMQLAAEVAKYTPRRVGFWEKVWSR